MRRLLAAGLVISLCSGALGADNPVQTGWELVQDYCSVCHATGAQGQSPHPEAPPFRSLHERYDMDSLAEGLVEGLVSGHPDMPEFEFDPAQAEAIIAYMKSLE